MSTIMVQIMDNEKTHEALHLASALARSRDSRIALVKMLPVQHWGWLGSELGYQNFTESDNLEIAEYHSLAENYGVEVEAHVFQYMTLVEGIVEAAAYVEALVVFATLPHSVIPFWYKFQTWKLKSLLTADRRQVYFMEQISKIDELPAILVPAVAAPPVRH